MTSGRTKAIRNREWVHGLATRYFPSVRQVPLVTLEKTFRPGGKSSETMGVQVHPSSITFCCNNAGAIQAGAVEICTKCIFYLFLVFSM